MSHHDADRQLEEFVHRVLRNQPMRQAPAQLADRVLARIEQRTAKAWWQAGFNAWPMPARVLFVTISIAICALALEVSATLFEVLSAQVPLTLARSIALWQAMSTAVESLAKGIPVQWIYVVGGIIAALYASFFALSAAAYRTLYQNR